MRWLALALVFSACATVQPSLDPTVELNYTDRMTARLEQSRGAMEHRLRYNPTSCRCPPFELWLHDTWQRVDLAVEDVDDPTLNELMQATSTDGREAGRVYRVEGELSADLSSCGGGLLYVTLEPTLYRGVTLNAGIRPAPESGP